MTSHIELINKPDSFWKESAKIITDVEYLSHPTKPVESLELGEKIAAKLIYTLNELNKKKKTGIGLTANQIGIDASVFVVNVNEPKYFINPDIVDFSKEQIEFTETCLSLPNKKVRIKRHIWVKVKADNFDEPIIFGEKYEGKPLDQNKLMEAIVIQHEFGHTQGILITDLDETPEPIRNDKKYGRNELIKIKRGDEIKEIKYKKLESFEKDGWIFV